MPDDPTGDDLTRDALAVLLPGFVGTEPPEWLQQRLAEGLAGVWLFAPNVESPEQCRRLTERLHAHGALVASDEEGGTVTRLQARAGSSWPSHLALGRVDDVGLTERVAEELGVALAEAGIDLTAAPDVDVNTDPRNPVIGVRSFGADPELVSRHSAAFVRGLLSAGRLACAKHFPGHGDTAQDSHLVLPRIDASPELLAARDLPPFRAAVRAGAQVVMTAHLVVPAYGERPATLNPELLSLLRDDLGFDGVICTDAIDMNAIAHGIGRRAGVVQALAAGADLICIGSPHPPEDYDAAADLESLLAAITDAVAAGELDRARLHEAAGRVRALRVREPRVRPGTAAGAEAARRALDVTGPAPSAVPTRVVGSGGRTSIAADAGQEVLVRAIAEGLGLPHSAPSDGVPDGTVVVTDDGTDLDAAAQQLAGAAAIVHAGFAPLPPSVTARRRVVRTFGGGRAAGIVAGQALMNP